MEQCKNCIWADQCPDHLTECSDYSPLDCDIDDMVYYALDLVDRSNTYQEMIDEMRDHG